jgi:ATP phosphoribosyltransferase
MDGSLITAEEIDALTPKERDALQLAKMLGQVVGNPNVSLVDQAKFLAGLLTKSEIPDIANRHAIRSEIRRQMQQGSVSFEKVGDTVGCSTETAQRVWRAMRDEYPPITSTTNDVCIAIPKESRAFNMVEKLFLLAGFEITRDGDNGQLIDIQNGVESFPARFLRGEDVIVYIKEGVVDIACYGNDKIEETLAEERLSGVPIAKMETFTRSSPDPDPKNQFRLSLAIPQENREEAERRGLSYLEGKKIATSYDRYLKFWLMQNGINAEVVKVKGGVESAIKDLGVDMIADIVQSGSSLRKNKLVEFGDPILPGEVRLFGIQGSNTSEAKRSRIEQICGRFEKAGLLQAAA